jgi:hypothetical protein
VRNHAHAFWSMFWMRLWTRGMAIAESPMMREGREDCIGRELWASVVAWAKMSPQVLAETGRVGRQKQRFDTDRPISRGSAGRAVLMKQTWQALC